MVNHGHLNLDLQIMGHPHGTQQTQDTMMKQNMVKYINSLKIELNLRRKNQKH